MEFGSLEIAGVGAFLPPGILTNENLARMIDTSNEWIVERTGIKERRIAANGIASTDLALQAAAIALEDARLEPKDLDLIIFSSTFSDCGSNVPRAAEIFKYKLAARNALSLEESVQCAGFDFALARARAEAAFYGFRRILVACGEKTTAFVNKNDRRTVILFGDGAGAVVLTACERDKGILSSFRATHPFVTNWTKIPAIEWISIPAGGSRMPATIETVQAGLHFIIMRDGESIMRYVVEEMPKACLAVCRDAGCDIQEVAAIVPHSANSRIIRKVEEKMRIGPGIILDNAEKVGNTSCSSVPIGLDRIYREGRLKPGDLVITVGFGAGMVLAANLIRWTKP